MIAVWMSQGTQSGGSVGMVKLMMWGFWSVGDVGPSRRGETNSVLSHMCTQRQFTSHIFDWREEKQDPSLHT